MGLDWGGCRRRGKLPRETLEKQREEGLLLLLHGEDGSKRKEEKLP
jgi:hypothetical protein